MGHKGTEGVIPKEMQQIATVMQGTEGIFIRDMQQIAMGTRDERVQDVEDHHMPEQTVELGDKLVSNVTNRIILPGCVNLQRVPILWERHQVHQTGWKWTMLHRRKT